MLVLAWVWWFAVEINALTFWCCRNRFQSDFHSRSLYHAYTAKLKNTFMHAFSSLKISTWGILHYDTLILLIINYCKLFVLLGIDDIISVLQPFRLRLYGRVLQVEDIDLMKKCMEYEVWSGCFQSKGSIKEDLDRGCAKKTVKGVNWAGMMLWIMVDGGSW